MSAYVVKTGALSLGVVVSNLGNSAAFLLLAILSIVFHNWSRLIHRYSTDAAPVLLSGKASGLI